MIFPSGLAPLQCRCTNAWFTIATLGAQEVRVGERVAAEDPDAEGLEVVTDNHAILDRREAPYIGGQRPIVQRDRLSPDLAHQGQSVDGTDRFRAGNRTNAIDDGGEDCSGLGVGERGPTPVQLTVDVFLRRDVELQRQYAVGIVAGRHMEQLIHAADHQASGREQDQRQRHLGCDEHAA
jgi:hypothetical protein